METVVYYYKILRSSAPQVATPSEWQVTGLFPGASDWETFKKPEFVEQLPPGPWAEEVCHGDGSLPVSTLRSDHAWIDLQNLFFAREHTATPVTVTDHSAYARASIESASDRKATLRLAVDDWCRVWLNGRHVADLRHESGLEAADIPVALRQGTNELLLKTNNTTMPPNNRLWVLSCVVEE